MQGNEKYEKGREERRIFKDVECQFRMGYAPQVRYERWQLTTLNIDEKLLAATLKAFGFKSKHEAVNAALSELLKKKKRMELVEMFGKVEYYPDYDYKKLRTRR